MSWLQAAILGLVQGVTEFFPISSSAHLTMARLFFGIEHTESQVVFDLFCHLGTLVAVLLFLKREIRELFCSERKKLVLLCVALLPLIPCYFLLKPLREWVARPEYLGFCLMTTACILFLGNKYRVQREQKESMKRHINDALWIGTMQATALLPGISRSASTISCARILGWEAQKAVRFSFLLSIPTIIGGNCLELLKMALFSHTPLALPFSLCAIGFFTSCSAGLLIIGRAMTLLEKGKIERFAWYCLVIGILAVYYLFIRR